MSKKKLEIKLVEDGAQRPKVRVRLPMAATAAMSSLIPSAVKDQLMRDDVDISEVFRNASTADPGELFQYRKENKTVTISIVMTT